jgi:hypothetical protein
VSAEASTMLSNIGSIVAILGWIVAAIAFIFGLIQYRKGQNWQRAQIMLSLIDSFEKNKRIEMACIMLDWDSREITTPEGKVFHFRNEMLLSALRVVEMDVIEEFKEEESLIRDAFDEFFDFFYKLYSFKRSGLLSLSDYAYFNYWFELLRKIGRYKKDSRIQETVSRYIDAYCFVGVKELLEEYGRKPDPIMKSIFSNE